MQIGADLADIEVIPNASRARQLYFQLVKAAKEEILLLFPTINAFTRQDKIVPDALLLSKEEEFVADTKEENVKVTILMSFNQLIEKKIHEFELHFPNTNEIRYIEPLIHL